jgi:hypothetical protein
MQKDMVVQGRQITAVDISHILQLIQEHPSWHRTKISRELCEFWNWRKENGQLKDMACRSLLLKLEKLGHIILPRRLREATNHARTGVQQADLLLDQTNNIHCDLKSLLPLKIEVVAGASESHTLFNHLLSRHHSLGFKTTVGENAKYLVKDSKERILSCALFGSAAWKTRPRDQFIGWNHPVRERNVNRITNNVRFLILPWIRVPHLASHILGQIARRIQQDWINKYRHSIYLLETFVDRERFKGTCYKAANWICLGQTKGRTRNDHHTSIHVSIKDVYVYPLVRDFRKLLCQ